ncbi:MAG: hypothetical protein NTY15_03505 [Planctomycetota bacterium]|nr:hypothetical protein [Planctomycetota bacterium]
MSGSSNGIPKPFQAAKPFKGVPVTVRVPTHVDIAVNESLFFNMPEMTPVCLSARNLQLTANYVYSDKIISVDPKRPFAGTLDYNMTFQNTNSIERDRQFFSKLNYDVKDETIKTIDNILKNVVPTLGLNQKVKSTGALGGAEESAPSNLKEIERVVAWKRFDISDQNLEADIASFVGLHMNHCHSCQGQQCAVGPVVSETMETSPLEMQ